MVIGKIQKLERQLGFTSERGLQRGGNGSLSEDIKLLLEGIDRMKKHYVDFVPHELWHSEEFEEACRALLWECGPRLWPGVEEQDSESIQLDELYPQVLDFTVAADREKLDALLFELIWEKCRSYYRNERSKPQRQRASAARRKPEGDIELIESPINNGEVHDNMTYEGYGPSVNIKLSPKSPGVETSLLRTMEVDDVDASGTQHLDGSKRSRSGSGSGSPSASGQSTKRQKYGTEHAENTPVQDSTSIAQAPSNPTDDQPIHESGSPPDQLPEHVSVTRSRKARKSEHDVPTPRSRRKPRSGTNPIQIAPSPTVKPASSGTDQLQTADNRKQSSAHENLTVVLKMGDQYSGPENWQSANEDGGSATQVEQTTRPAQQMQTDPQPAKNPTETVPSHAEPEPMVMLPRSEGTLLWAKCMEDPAFRERYGGYPYGRPKADNHIQASHSGSASANEASSHPQTSSSNTNADGEQSRPTATQVQSSEGQGRPPSVVQHSSSFNPVNRPAPRPNSNPPFPQMNFPVTRPEDHRSYTMPNGDSRVQGRFVPGHGVHVPSQGPAVDPRVDAGYPRMHQDAGHYEVAPHWRKDGMHDAQDRYNPRLSMHNAPEHMAKDGVPTQAYPAPSQLRRPEHNIRPGPMPPGPPQGHMILPSQPHPPPERYGAVMQVDEKPRIPSALDNTVVIAIWPADTISDTMFYLRSCPTKDTFFDRLQRNLPTAMRNRVIARVDMTLANSGQAPSRRRFAINIMREDNDDGYEIMKRHLRRLDHVAEPELEAAIELGE